jgi:electron transfer flavoprotein alpha subunit
VVIRDGVLPAGADEAVAECGGRALLVGSGTCDAVESLSGIVTDVRLLETGSFRPARWAAGLSSLLADEAVVVLPGSPDGRDLAPRLAHALGRPYFAQAMQIGPDQLELIRDGGLQLVRVPAPPTFVATMHPGLRGAERSGTRPAAVTEIEFAPASPDAPASVDADVVATLAADAATIDLAESARIVAGGAGLDSQQRFTELAALGVALGAGVGATRVVTDRGWVGHERQIGTTGVVVDPQLYVAFGISGAVQHTSGLGSPAHVISINTDAHCPMMQMSDLAVVADANAVLAALIEQLSAVVNV